MKTTLLKLALGACIALTAPAAFAQTASAPPYPVAANLSDPAVAIRGASDRWSQEQARDWYGRQPWIVGADFAPSTAINQLEMFQAETFDPATIDRELGWAHDQFGMNTMRVYLHDMLWKQDPQGFKQRLDRFLAIADKHGIRPILVLFDSCWDPNPRLGPQHRPIPGVHNSGWVQTPGRDDLLDARNDNHFKSYVQGVVGAFAKDRRVLMWDIWNEPDNPGGGSFNQKDEAYQQEQRRIEVLLPQAFEWARAVRPTQPLTSGVWIGDDWSPGAPKLNTIQRVQLGYSDVITFHNYEWPESFENRIRQLRPYGRPLICTEWMARGNGSTADTILPIARRENIGMVNWGLVDGAIQTRLPWDSWERPYTLQEPPIWFHDLFRKDGTPYRQREAEVFRSLEAQPAGRPVAARP